MATDLAFIQLSDLHLLADPGELHGVQPDHQLAAILAAVVTLRVPPAFCLITGDLSQDGSVASYQRLRTLLEPLDAAGIPFYVGLGNHDQRAAFRAGFLGEQPTDERYYYATELADLRLIMLDSLVPGANHGELGQEQLAWLAKEVQQPAPRGTILALHHPVALAGMPWLAHDLLCDAAALETLLATTNVRTVLSGHCHAASAATFAQTVAVTAPAVVFQARPGVPTFVPQLRSGFNLCTLEESRCLVTPILF